MPFSHLKDTSLACLRGHFQRSLTEEGPSISNIGGRIPRSGAQAEYKGSKLSSRAQLCFLTPDSLRLGTSFFYCHDELYSPTVSKNGPSVYKPLIQKVCWATYLHFLSGNSTHFLSQDQLLQHAHSTVDPSCSEVDNSSRVSRPLACW